MNDDPTPTDEPNDTTPAPLHATMEPALTAFRQARNISAAELAAWLGMAPAALPLLAAGRQPDPGDTDYHARCAELAALTGADAFALRTLLRWYYRQG